MRLIFKFVHIAIILMFSQKATAAYWENTVHWDYICTDRKDPKHQYRIFVTPNFESVFAEAVNYNSKKGLFDIFETTCNASNYCFYQYRSGIYTIYRKFQGPGVNNYPVTLIVGWRTLGIQSTEYVFNCMLL